MNIEEVREFLWLKDRRERELLAEELVHYGKVVSALVLSIFEKALEGELLAMNFMRKFFFNFVLLVILLAVMYFVMPDFMGAIYQLYYGLLGPGLLLLLLLYTAFPNGRR